MGYDGLISREEVLAGLPGGRARTLLAAIEHHTVQLAERSRWALAAFLTRETDRAPRVDFLDTFRRIHRAGVLPTTADLERYAPLWQHLVPVDPKVLAAVSHLLGGKYGLAPDSTPQIRQALRWDTPAVQQAYEELYQRPLQRLFAPSPPPREQPDRPSPAPWLASAVLRDIEAELQSVHLAAGDVLFRQGDVADSLYIVIHGRLQVAAGEGQGGQILREVGPGESIGATTVLAEELHATTAYAVRDTALARLSKAAFDRLVEHHPRAAMQIVRTVMARGGRSSRSTGRTTNTVIGVAVAPAGRDVSLSAFAGCLAAALGEYGPTLHLTAERLDAALERGMAQAPVDDARNSLIAAWLGEQETTYRYIVYEADRTPSHWTRRCLRQADRILLVGMGESDPAPGEIEAELARMPRTGRQELILLHRDGPPGPAGARGWLARRRVAAHHHVRPAVPEDVRRLARRLTGRALGLVLGGGGARGWAHVGVIRAFEEAGLPIDLIGGTSMGGLIAAWYALGVDRAGMVE